MTSEVRSRKKANKKNTTGVGKNARLPEESKVVSPKLESLSVQLAALRDRVADNKDLFSEYKQLLQSEISERSPPRVKCHIFSLCKPVLKVLWVMFLVLLLIGGSVGLVIYKVERYSDAFSMYIQENMYDLMRYARFAVIALSPIFPRLLKLCLVPNPFSPAYKCACMEGITIKNHSLDLGLPAEEVVLLTKYPQMGYLSNLDAYALKDLYWEGGKLQDPCAEFGAEGMEASGSTDDEESKYEIYFNELFKSTTSLKKQLKSSAPWKAIWQECGPPTDKKSVMDLIPMFKPPPGYEFVSNPVIYASGQWARYYHIPELWVKEPSWIVITVLYGGVRISIDGGFECMEHCVDRKNMVLKPGDTVVLHEKHWNPSWQSWGPDHTIAMVTSVRKT